jgi:hypothetical protein
MISISTKEWRFVVVLGLFLLSLTSLPTFIGLISTPQANIFLGLQSSNFTDTPVYYSWIEQTKEGNFFFKNLFTSEPEPRFIFDPFWLAVGFFAKMFSLSSLAAYQFAKLFLIFVFCGVGYIFISYFFKQERERKIGFLFLIFASGLGAITTVIIKIFSSSFWPLPMDLWVPEAFTFYTLYQSPHFIASLTLMLVIFLLTLLFLEKQKIIYSVGAAIASLFLFQFHPYQIITVFGVLGIFALILTFKNRKINFILLKHYLIIILFSSPAIIYHLWTLQKFWTRQQFAIQNICLTPDILTTFLSYGFLMILTLFGVVNFLIKKNYNQKTIFLLAWLPTQFLLIYAPVNFQRRLTEGLQVVLAIMSVVGFLFLREFANFKNYQKKYPFLFQNKFFSILLFILLFSLSNFYILIKDLNYYLSPPARYSAYISNSKGEAIRWLKENTTQNSIVLSDATNGNLIPAIALRTVYLGQWGMTADVSAKVILVKSFFETYNNKSRADFLRINKIDYLFYGAEEKTFTNFNPETVEYLENVYQNGEVVIYKVVTQ